MPEQYHEDFFNNSRRIQDLNAKKIHKLLVSLEEANRIIAENARQKELFMAHLSHEIFTPINAIYGFANLLIEDEEYGQFNQKQQEHLAIIRDSSTHLVELLKQFLGHSKLQSSETKLIENNYQSHQRFQEILNTFRLKAEEKGLQLQLEIHHEVPAYIFGDVVKVSQIIRNLLTNAIKFTSKGIVGLQVSIHERNQENFILQISVKDSGPGISEMDLGNIFESFQQGEEGTKTSDGFGLGLSITKKLIQFLNAEIQVESKLGEGSTFIVKIPQKIGQEPIVEPTSDTSRLTEKKMLRLLVADDNEVNLIFITNILSRQGYQFHCVRSGEELISALDQRPYDLILSDWKMPGLSESELLKEIKSHPNGEVPVIIISANQLSPDLKKNELRFDAYLHKPFHPEELLKQIQQFSFPSHPKKWGLRTLETICNGDKSLMNEIIFQLLEDLPIQCSELNQSLKETNWEGLQQCAHRMLSNARLLDAEELVKPLRFLDEAQVELLSKMDSELETKLIHVNEVTEQIIQELKNLISD
ncbi:MAG: response regulator [Bacteroidetes bacterium]|nr:MAG: response regulator [Bacteroidota bacterium]